MSAAQNTRFEKLRGELDQTHKSLTRMIDCLEELDEEKLQIDERMERHVATISPWKPMRQGSAGEEVAPVRVLGETDAATLRSLYDQVYLEYLRLLTTVRDVGGRLAEMGHFVSQ
jgi:hypothetical protein